MSSLVSFLSKKQNLPIVIIPLVLLLWAQFGATPLGLASFNSATNHRTPYAANLAPGNSGDALAKNVVVIVVDGLRVDTSQQMATLNQLRAQGADRTAQVGIPSLSLPGWTVIGTGAWQEQDGITSNYTKDSIALDTIFLAAKRKGLTTALVGAKGWDQLYASGVDVTRVITDPVDAHSNADAARNEDVQMTTLALDVLKTNPNLMLIHLPGVDNTSHGFGGASAQTAETARLVDIQIKRLVDALDLKQTALFVTADHGHIDSGGHSGNEAIVLNVPLVSAGQGIKPGKYSGAYQADIAPTVAVLLGTSFPEHNQGDALLDELDAPDALKAARALDNAKEIATRYDSILQTISNTPQVDEQYIAQAQNAFDAKNYAQAITAAQQSNANARALAESERNARLNRERLIRIPLALILFAPFVLYFWWWSRAKWNWIPPLAGALAYFALWNLNYFLVDHLYYSSSLFNSDELILAFLKARVVEAIICLVLVSLLVGLMTRRALGLEVFRNATNMLFLIATGFAIQILFFYVLWDFTFSWYLPDFTLGFKYYLDVFQTTAFWPLIYLPLAAVLPFIALLSAWVFNKIEWRLNPKAAARK